MKLKTRNASARQIDSSLKIFDVFDGKNADFDFVIAQISGNHPIVINRESQRAYYVLEGSGSVLVGAEWQPAETGDFFFIEKGTPHSVEGDMRYLIITSPPFDPANEDIVE